MNAREIIKAESDRVALAASTMSITFDNEAVEVLEVNRYSYLPQIELEDDREFYVAESHESAGAAAREYWEDMANDDPQELACIVGEKNLVAWALGQSAGPGSIGVNSLSEWLDLYLDAPAEQWAGYDGNEYEVESASQALVDELGFDTEPTEWVVYRWN